MPVSTDIQPRGNFAGQIDSGPPSSPAIGRFSPKISASVQSSFSFSNAARHAFGDGSRTSRFPQLGTFKSPFTEISLAYPKAPKGAKPYAWSFFIDSCARRGQAAALEMLPKGLLRKKYQKSIEAAHDSFWRPKTIWVSWEETMNVSGLHP
jgi:hypothetical protein